MVARFIDLLRFLGKRGLSIVLYIVYCLVSIAYCLLPIQGPIAYRLPPIAHCLLPIAYRLSPIDCRLFAFAYAHAMGRAWPHAPPGPLSP